MCCDGTGSAIIDSKAADVLAFPRFFGCSSRGSAGAAAFGALASVFYIVTGEPFKQSAELTREPIKMKG